MEKFGEISTLPMMENQPVVLGNQNGGAVSGTTPALYVLVKQSTGKTDQGILVSNRDDCGFASNATTTTKPKVKTYLAADCTSGNITVTLDNNNMWNEFYHRSTEMILTKQGRRMFPYCRYWIAGLEPNLKYILVMDISPVDSFRYKWNGHSWEPSGKAEPHVLGRVFIHPESPSTGDYWMHQLVSFYKLKLTNNTLDQEGHIILHSMHRYLPRLHLVPADKATEVIQLNGPDVHTFTFPQTEFFAVTAYQNIQITQLKIDYNPFAKGFRDDGLSSRLQRDVKQNGSSEQEEGSVTSSPSIDRHPTDDNTLDTEHGGLGSAFNAMCNTNLERDSLSPYHDFLGFMETDVHGRDPVLKHEASESSVASPCQSTSHVASPLNSNGDISVVIKEEPVDDYEYGPSVCMDEINVKQEEADNMAVDYSNKNDSILEQQLKRNTEMSKKEIEIRSEKQPQASQLGVAKAKMLKLDSGKMPVVYLEPCAVTRNTVKVSALSHTMLSPSRNEKSLSDSVDSLPICFENNIISRPFSTMEAEHISTEKELPENLTQKYSSVKEILWNNTETSTSLTITKKVSDCSLKTTAYNVPSLTKVISGLGKTNTLKNIISCKSIVGNQKVGIPTPRKRGRPRKIKFPGVGRPPKYTEKPIKTSNYTPLASGNTHLDVKPDLEDVDGMLFVSFASKEALDIHTVDRAEEKELPNKQSLSLGSCSPYIDPDVQRIQQLEKELLEDLKSFKYKQVIHPSLQEVGLKLNFVDPTMSIDLKYLGVQLPLSYSDDYTLWKNIGINSSSTDTGLPFISRTGKTNDFTKIKGWRGKLHSSSRNEGIIIEASLKNRSAFCSDKLDEYLENEGKLMETSAEFSASTSSCPVVYQLPTKSTSYVRTLDSVLKKQSTVTTSSSSYTFKPLSVPSVSRKKREKVKNKKQVSKSKEKLPHKPVIALPVVTKQKHNLTALEEKVSKSQSNSQVANGIGTLMMPGIDDNVQGKQFNVRQTQQQSNRLPTLSKTHLKLMDLEDCALWDGKPRTFITEERADLSLTTLLTAQASLKNKPIHKIIKRRAPPCNNDFCRLGCICSSLALEKRQPTHCRKPDCMFGCTCLKRKVVLVKGSSKHKRIIEKPLHGKHKLYRGKKIEQQEVVMEKEEQEKLKLKDKRRKKKVEYAICDTEPDKPVKNFPLWVKVDGEMDPEPVYIPTPSAVEPTKPLMPPLPEGLPSDNIPAVSEMKPIASGVKSSRVYTPRPNPLIREEDKDPVYLYFESMMTCARVRIHERKTKEKRQQQKCPRNSEKPVEKEHDPQLQSLNIEEDKEPGEKNWWFSCSAEDPSTSYIHHTTPEGRTKLIEIISDCNWEEDRNEILNILSQYIKNKIPKSLKVGNFVIDLKSQSKTWDEKNTPIYSSRVKITSCQNKSEKAHISGSEAPNNQLSPCKRTETITFLTPGMLREQRKKGLPFYAGLSPAGKLIAYTCKSGLNPSSLIQANGKNYPQAKLLLGQMGALHPASRLAAYLTGRLRPAMLDLTTISTVISKVASNAKQTASEPQSAEVSTSENAKVPLSSESTLLSPVTAPNVLVSTHGQTVAQPVLDGMTSQLVMTAVGTVQQKVPGVRTPQPLTGPQNFNVKSTPLSSGTATVITTVAATNTVASLPVTTRPVQCSTSGNPSGTTTANAAGKAENATVSTTTATTATVKITKTTGIVTPAATTAFAKSAGATSTPIATTSQSTLLSTTASTATATTLSSSIGCVGSGASGIPKSPLSHQKSGTTSPPGLPPGAEKRMGPRLLLIPVHQGSPTLRPPQNMQLAQGKRMILQPLRNPGGVNLYRHPNGQIIQLVPLHQLQPAGPQPSLPSVMFRNPGSVVGIRLPGPSKAPETSVCQSSVVSPVTPTTTISSVLSMTPPALSASPTTDATSVLSGTSSTTTTPTTEATFVLSVPATIVSTPPAAEGPSVLSMSPTSNMPLLSTPPSAMPMPHAAEGPSVLSMSPTSNMPFLPTPPSAVPHAAEVSPMLKTNASLALPPTVLMPPVTEVPAEVPLVLPITSSVTTVPATCEIPSSLPMPCTADSSLVSPMASSALPTPPNTSPSTSWTLQTIRSVSALPISAAQAGPVISPAPVPVSQTGTLTLRICPAGIKSIATQISSNPKITFSSSGQSNNVDNLVSLHSGSFALLHFPGEKAVSSSTEKDVASLDVRNMCKKNEVNAVTLEEKTTCSQTVKVMASEVELCDPKLEENKTPASQPDCCSKEITCDRNTENDTLAQLSIDTPTLEPDVCLDHSSISKKQTCGENEVMVKGKLHVKHPEDTLDKIPYSSETIPERGSKTTVCAQEQKVTQLKNSQEKQTHSDQMQSVAAHSKEAEETQLEREEGIITEESWKSMGNYQVHMNSTEKLQKKTTCSLRICENQDSGLLRRKMKEMSDSAATENREGVRGKPKITSAKGQGDKYLDSVQECSRNTGFLENTNTSGHKKSATDIQEEIQPVKDKPVHVSRTWSKISRQAVAFSNKIGMYNDDHVEKLTECAEQNTQKKHCRKDSLPIIDITMDDTEKDEKIYDSADEIVDEVSGYQSEDIVNVETLNESESSEAEENVDIETVEELSEKINIARLKATATHALLSKELNHVCDNSNKTVTKTAKQSESSNKKPKNEEEAFANYRQTHTANERRRRKEMRGLFEKLKATLPLHTLPKVSKCFILKQAFEEIQGLTDQADKLIGQKNLLMRKQDTLIRKVSALSGKTQEVVLKKLEYIYAKQKAVEIQKKNQYQQTEPMKTTDTARPSVENSPSSILKEMKPVILSNKRAKPLILSRKGSNATEDAPPSMTLTNTSLVMTANGQVLAFKSPLVPGQVASLPSSLLQTELKSENDGSNGTTQPGIASVMIQLPGSAVPVQVKGILPTSAIPVALSAVATSSPSSVVETAPELTSENEDSFMMPRIVNVTSLATEGKKINLDVDKNPYITGGVNSQTSEPSLLQVVSQETTNQSEGKAGSSGKERNATGTLPDFLGGKDSFPQIVNVSSLKGTLGSFSPKFCIEELSGSQARTKQMDKGGDCQRSKESSFQKVQVNEPKGSGLEMELQKVASVIHEPTLDANDLMDIEENDDTDETLTSLLNEIAFLNQQLNDDASDISELPNSLSSGFSLGDMESRRESNAADGSPFQFGAMSGSFKDLSVVQENSDSIAPLLLHLDDDDLSDGNRNSGELSAESDALKIMLGSELKAPDPDLSAIHSGGSRKSVEALAKKRSVSPPILHMKTNVEAGNTDMTWRPMPKLAPLGLKASKFPLDSEGQNNKMMPSLAPVAAKEMKTVQPLAIPRQDSKAVLASRHASTKSK
ncbi:MAX gene-associated protein-like isoform X3 [Varanus komodoensis]|uniref:MAX gene-associated protein n=1 Tax=Varanus komodoensis TaxID=61221 RepID=A0A8D2KXE8_VARKO|nr:MAX gene-associated protein-like isoform X3 [Varanus komodoensis]